MGTMVSARDREKFANTNSEQGGITELTKNLKKNVFRSLKVATLAKITELDDTNKIIKVSPIPLIYKEQIKSIDCYGVKKFKDDGGVYNIYDNLKLNDYVLVIFLDRNTIQNIQQIQKEQELSYRSENEDLHSDKFGIVIDLFYRKEEEEGE